MGYLGTKPSNQTPTYKLKSEFVATAGQTVFAPSAYTAGYIDVYRNGVKLGNADFTATNGTTVTLAQGATAGDLITFESVYLASIQNGIPATAGAVSTSLIADNAITAAKMAAGGAWAPTGTVIQVVNASLSATVSGSTSTYVDTGLSVSITPKFATSKVLVVVDMTGLLKQTGNAALGLKLVRNSTDILVFEAIAGYTNTTTTNAVGGSGASYIDSPATTSATTYKVQLASLTSNAVVYVNQNYSGVGYSTITLMEIAG